MDRGSLTDIDPIARRNSVQLRANAGDSAAK